MECESKLYARHCNCVLHYMPRANEDVPFCGRSDSKCTEKVSQLIHSKANQTFVCDCLPGCFDIHYDLETSMAPIMPGADVLTQNNWDPQNIAILHIFFKQHYFRSQVKEELVGFTDFLCKFTLYKLMNHSVSHLTIHL